MKRISLFLIMVFATSFMCQSQEWMTNLDIAKRLASVQNKMILMVWEESTVYPFPVVIKDSTGNVVVVENLFEDEKLNQVIWTYFVPVKVSETDYAKLFEAIKDTRSQSYIAKFNDDFFKVLDVNGTIINSTEEFLGDYFNFSEFVVKYALDTSFLKQEFINYKREKDVNTSFRLASQYIDYAALVNEKVRPDIIKVSSIYLEEAFVLLPESDVENKSGLNQRLDLLKLKQDLVLNKPKKVLRQLKRMDETEIEPVNQPLIAFLYLASHLSLGDENSASQWRSKVSLVNLKLANTIITNNLNVSGNHN